MRTSLLPELKQVFRLDLEQSALDGGRATQPPQQARQSENQFSFDRRLRVVVGCNGHFEGRIVLGIFQRVDHGFSREAMTERILALFGDRTRAQTRIAAVGLDLTQRTHSASGPRIGFVSLF